MQHGMSWHQKLFSLTFFAFFLTLNLIMQGDFTGDYYKNPFDGDCFNYVAMAQNTTAQVAHPFGLRILTPLIVKIIKKNSYGLLSWDCTWYLVTCAGLFATALMFWRLLRKVFGLDLLTANVAVILLLGNWVYSFFQLHVPFFPDPLNNFFWVAAVYWLHRQRYGLFLITVTVGFLNKEVILFLLPLYPLFVCLDTRERARLPAALAASLGLLLLVILAYLGFRRGWSHYIGADQFQLFTGWKLGPKELMLHCLSKQKDVLNIYATFHFLWFPFLLMLWQLYQENGWRDKFVLSCGYLVLALLFGRLFATDANRVFVMLAPWVVGLAALYFQRIRLRENPPALLALVFIYLAINYGWVENREWQIAFDTVALLILAVQSHRMSRTPASSAQG
jgi:hypothetical protein